MRLPAIFSLSLALFSLAVRAAGADEAHPLYRDPAQPIEARVRDLVSRMTLEEKAAEMKNTTPGVPRLGVPRYDWWNEALHGVARSGEATVFPQAIGLAATWDDALMQKIAGTIAIEARAKYNNAEATGTNAGKRYFGLTFWTPNINIFRDPRWGRGQETYGEDPWLTSRIGVAFVRGLQGDDPHYLMAAACAKHFAVHSGPESLRHTFDVAPSDEDFHETYLPAFEALVREGHVEAVMTAYNSLYGKPAAINPKLYALLDQWGFNGHVTSDCGAIADLSRTYKVAKDDAEAEAMSISAGLCVRCGDNPPALADAVKRGLIKEEVVDQQLGKLLRTMFRLGFFDPPENVPFSKIPFAENNSAAHAELALRATRESMVLLKNDGTLPLDRAKLKRVALIGPNADSIPALLGNYNGKPTAPVTILAGLQAALGDGVTIDYVRGSDYAASPRGLRPIPRSALTNGEGPGLMGDYFDGKELAGSPTPRRDRQVNFDFTTANPPGDVAKESFSVRWRGNVVPTMPGDYNIVVSGRGGFRLIVGGTTAIDAWTPEEKTRTASVKLSAGENPIVLEYFKGDGVAKISLQWEPPDPAAGIGEAIAAARGADAIIYVGGISAQLEGEEMTVDYEGFKGGDRTIIELPAPQQALLEKLTATGKPVVFVNMSGSAVAFPWADAHVNAILQAWYPGQAGGTAVADVLLGKTNPAGRLPITFYRATSDLPAFEDYAMTNRTYRYFSGQALYAFGHGLSYTTFDYAKPKIFTLEDKIMVSVAVKNTGGRDGDEVVQVYATPPGAREREALSAFKRVHLAKGETQNVELVVPATALRRWSAEKHDYAVPRGEWKVMIGASSADIRQTATARLE